MSGHARERAAWFLGALASATLAMAGAAALPPALATVACSIAFAIVPGAWLARSLAPEEPSDARAALALLLAPFACGSLLVLSRLAGMGAVPAARALASVLALLSAWEALRPRRRAATPPGDRGVWVVALVVGTALVAAHLASPALSQRSDGAFHAGVVWASAHGIPPEDPFFAGLPLRYFWGLHAWAAAWLALAPGLGAYAPLVMSNAFAAAAALLAVGALARRLGASPRASLLAQALVLAGTAPGAWLLLVARANSGTVRGAAELARALGRGADTALRALDPGLLHPSLVLPLDKFVVLTPFAWGLAGAALVALSLGVALETPGWRPRLRLAGVLAAVLFAHPIAGGALLLATLAGAAWASVRVPGARPALAGIALALGAGTLVMLPYLFSLGGSAAGGVAWGVARDLRGFGSAAYAGAFLLPWAAHELMLRRGGEAASEPGRAALAAGLAGMLAALVLPACVLRLDGDNQSKFLNLAFLLAAAPAALAWARGARDAARAVALALLLAVGLLPTVAVVLWAYIGQSDTSDDAPSRPPHAISLALRELAPGRVLLVDATQDTTRGAAPALPGESGQALLWSGGFMARKWGYASGPLQLRQAAASALAHGQWPAGAAGQLVRSLGREPWVIALEDSAHATDARWRVVARADGVVLARFAVPR